MDPLEMPRRAKAIWASALVAFQRSKHLPETGRLDPATRETLLLSRPPFTNYVVTQSDLTRLQPLSGTWAAALCPSSPAARRRWTISLPDCSPI